ncbi:uncharacterized protein GGS22DRAFT_174795 [Annulohypoxylon maeteangense]|uniref:uncharacterized protein n=1 Tax=Annulohypoxylon maeteangense TaxID=1927788 RepID=UPI0020081750|nr:uncharacterized protein GGS22DRAFT_174795 [Annulohypoxylon maeteangense]KAI0880600.1 hypothetical protein GGS22DRAFT_174795 [Annulohypoxylon maeteangense]
MESDRPETTVLGRPKPTQQPPRTIAGPGVVAETIPRAGITTSITAGPVNRDANRSSTFEFRGFDFFANRDFNELKNASRAYFAPAASSEKHQRLPSTWLGDATPPASPRPSREVRAIGGGIGGERLLPPLGGQVSPPEKRIFGLRRTQFWWLVALITLLLVVAIGVGVGVGVGKGASQSSTQAQAQVGAVSSSSSATTSLGSNTSVATGTPTTPSGSSATRTSDSSSSTSSSEGKIDCPAANGTTYQVPGSEKQFLRICGIDYSGDEATDLRHVPTESMLDCMKNCAGTSGCTGCGWGYIQGDTGNQHTCWLKGSLKKSHEADINWAFAVLL